MEQLKNKVALISGASRGLGFALAQALGNEGMKLVISARGEKRLENARKQLEAMGYDVTAVSGDIGKWEDVQRIVEQAKNVFKRIDLVINNAGVSMRGRFEEFSEGTYGKIISTNVLGSINLTLAALDSLKKTKGQVLFISSITGLIGLPISSVYGASKGALKNLCEALRIELNPNGVHAGVVYLGYTEHDPEKRIFGINDTLIIPDWSGPSSQVKGQSQTKAAKTILKMIKRRKRQLVTTPLGRLCYLAYRISPFIVEKAIIWTQKRQSGFDKNNLGKSLNIVPISQV
jgi:dehydrogenase/reductase SDR family protein 7B